MKYLKAYIDELIDRGNPQLAESIQKTANEVGDKYIRSFSFISHETGLLFGNVQSGKTGQMFGIICKAADFGFPAFLILSTDNVVLQQQTLQRVREDLKDFCICGENDSKIFIENKLLKPVIVVLKKNARMLKLWANIFNNTKFMTGNPLFILDDEADAASLNTMVNKNKQSSINKYLDDIKNGSSSSMYLQVTGTPQALFLQSLISGWQPTFTYYFRPGKGYLGGDFFFQHAPKEHIVKFIDNENDSIIDMIIHHLVVSSIILKTDKVCNCILHPGVRQVSHEVLANKVNNALNWCYENFNGEFKVMAKQEYETLHPIIYQKPDFEYIYATIEKYITNKYIKIIIMNGKNEVAFTQYGTGCNIIIGGNTLGRGVTFPKLHTIYYTRFTKKPQADTMWQHSRMFGYDRDAGLIRLYISRLAFKLFADINTENNSIIEQVMDGVEKIKIKFPKNISPTRKNVLDNKKITTIMGGTNYYPYMPKNDSIEDIDNLLRIFDDKEPYYQVNLRLILQILNHIEADDDFNIKAFREFIENIIIDKSTAQGILLVRRERDIAQGTGAILSPNDWSLGKSFEKQVVVTMYKVTGNKGWNKQKLWIPNIKLPEGIVYFDLRD